MTRAAAVELARNPRSTRGSSPDWLAVDQLDVRD
jgi:hypothetical protein